MFHNIYYDRAIFVSRNNLKKTLRAVSLVGHELQYFTDDSCGPSRMFHSPCPERNVVLNRPFKVIGIFYHLLDRSNKLHPLLASCGIVCSTSYSSSLLLDATNTAHSMSGATDSQYYSTANHIPFCWCGRRTNTDLSCRSFMSFGIRVNIWR